ncbi:MAG TPA: UDP-glucose 4-epimerase GalE [Acidobacteriota bacterium]|nr:UDP-glucose 4-epimerase GalE [Acidobacteriota bacterium]
MKVLVTGGAGYIGSVVVEELIRKQHEPIVFDNLSAGHRESIPADVPLITGDLRRVDQIRQAFKEHQIEAVIHMAASALVGESVSKPREYYNNNLFAGLTLLNTMLDAGIRKIVFSSTAAVYGEPAHVPIIESEPTYPQNPYGETKLAMEKALRWYADAYGLQYVVLRYFNAAGATERCGEVHEPETHLIPIVLQAASGKRPFVEIYGDDWPTRDGTCIRDYIHVSDLARAHILGLARIDEGNHTYNLGCGGGGYSVREVIEAARGITGKDIHARVARRRQGDPAVLVASSAKIQRELGWRPRFQNLDVLLGSAWEWLLKHPNGYSG